MGDALLFDARFRSAFLGTEHVGACAIAVEAKSERVAGWYWDRGFRRSRTDPLLLTLALVAIRANASQSDREYWLGPEIAAEADIPAK
ncbi:MAG: hypothetical protein JWO62_3337 [Acidimicrobiaceae bacterium]|nr:hypothetical protein [Acidimicrobiaceae bacterium]